MLDKDFQYHVHLRKGDVGRYVIIPGDPGRCEAIAALLDNASEVSYNREYHTYTGSLLGESVSVCSSGIGGPSLAIAVHELVNCGADTFVRVGTSGGMNPKVLAGDVVIASGAIRMEGTTKEYMPIEFPAVAHYDVVTALKNACMNLDFPHHIGVVECKDSFYGQQMPETMPVGYELENKWRAWVAGGTLCSEMESAALFVVSAVLGVRSGAVLTVLHNQERRRLGLPDNQVHDATGAIAAGVEAVKLLIAQDQAAKQ